MPTNPRFSFFLLSVLVAAAIAAAAIAIVQFLMDKAAYAKPPRADVLAACSEQPQQSTLLLKVLSPHRRAGCEGS